MIGFPSLARLLLTFAAWNIRCTHGNLGPIFNLSGVSETNFANITCTEFLEAGCTLQAAPGSSIQASSPISICQNGQVGWAPTLLDSENLELVSCSSGDCSAQCTADCSCIMSADGSDCPTQAELSPSTLTPRAPILPESCTAMEQTELDMTYSDVCPNIMSGALPVCPCTYFYCDGAFRGCGPMDTFICLGTTERCVYSDRMCPTVPTMAPVPTTAAPTMAAPTCASLMITNRDTCRAACGTGSASSSNINGIVSCTCNGVLLCRDGGGLQPTMTPTSGASIHYQGKTFEEWTTLLVFGSLFVGLVL